MAKWRRDSWRNQEGFEWISRMNHGEAIVELTIYVDMAEAMGEFSAIESGEALIDKIREELDDLEENPEWPTNSDIEAYCGKYKVGRRVKYLDSVTLSKEWTSAASFESWCRVERGCCGVLRKI